MCWAKGWNFFVSVTLLVTMATCLVKEPEPCKDRLSNCDAFNNSACSYIDWAEENCAKTCGICTGKCSKGWSFYEADEICITGFGFTTDYGDKGDLHLMWNEARLHCQELDSDLIVIKDENIHAFVSNIFGYFSRQYWIGIKNMGQSKFDFQYVDGSKLGSYHPWSHSNPNKDVFDSCVVMNQGKDGTWVNLECNYFKAFVCEKPAN